MDRDQRARRLRLGHDFGRSDATLSWLADCGLTRAARPGGDVESYLAVPSVRTERSGVDGWRGTRGWPTRSTRRGIFARISPRRRPTRLDLRGSWSRAGKARLAAAFAKYGARPLSNSRRQRTSPAGIAPCI